MKKTVLITGASRGIGKATVIKFAQNNYNVILNYKNSSNEINILHLELNNIGVDSLVFKADISDSIQVNKMIEASIERFGKIDVLINNAGIAQQKLITDITDDDWNDMISVNLTGTFNCCRSVLPFMINQKSGCIVNLSSIWGIVGASMEVHYSAVKAGIIGLTKALAKEVGPSGVRVNCVAPGVIETDMNSNLSNSDLKILIDETPLERIGTPYDIAETIYYLSSAKAQFITGQTISPNGGFVI